jgi:xanthosine utilization system XapX-like protein
MESVRTTVAIFLRNSAIGTLILSALAGWLLWPLRRSPSPRRNWAIVGVLGIMVVTSLYQLIWLEVAVLN